LRIFEEEKEKIMIQNEKQISMLLTEPEALCYSDAINLLHSCLPPANKEIIDKAIENIMAALKFGAYCQVGLKLWLNFLEDKRNEISRMETSSKHKTKSRKTNAYLER
jgi:hypothetical protein